MEQDHGFLSGGGETGALIRARDWAGTPLGPIDGWPQSLRTSVSLCLKSRFAILIWWGGDLVKLYNDAYATILGRKHPQALGSPGREVWPEIWHIIGPMLEGVMQRGEATWSDNLLLELERNGYPEECYFTFSYSPIHAESGGVGGIFTPVQETTEQVIGERRLRTLRDLAAAARASNARTVEEVCQAAAATLAENPYDIPFAEIYLAGTETPLGIFRDRTWGETAEIVPVPQDAREVPRGAWPAAPAEALATPIAAAGRRVGTLVLGVSPRKRLEGDYRSFFDLVAGHVNTAVADVLAFEEQRRRAEALAELDRAKTAFFSNVSHEFRTPLTLMLGPLEEILAASEGVTAGIRELVTLTHRNALRLQKLVNTLLDFSRIEAGRLQAAYEPVDLSSLTAELASTFRAAMEKAGLRFEVDCPALPEPVYVDREMWEKVVLNLLSNAFKYTFEGGVTVRIRVRDGSAELTVEDTGTGIPASELPHIFERFHRVEGARGRTQEGTGIGLALVAELVKMHGGSIEARSIEGQGSAFTVALPFGSEHLRAEWIGAGGTASPAFRSEAWGSEAWAETGKEPAEGITVPAAGGAGRVLVVDDNADMRAYVARLLAESFEVDVAANGEEALTAIERRTPDVILSDVMMPRMDGFGLLKALRTNPATSAIPLIMLSARAGEEASGEGLAAGANDYLVKPFTARELMARVRAHMQMVHDRRRAAEREARLLAEAVEILESVTDGFLGLDSEWRFTYVNAAAEDLLGVRREDLQGRNHWEVFEPARGTALEREYRRTMRDRVAGEFENFYEPWQRWFAVRVYPTAGGGISVYFRDISRRRQAEQTLRDSEERFRTLAATVPQLIWTTKPDGETDYLNQQWEEYVGLPRERIFGGGWKDVIHPDDLAHTVGQWRRSIETGEPLSIRNRFRHHSGEFRWQLVRGNPIRNDAGEITRWVGTCTDIQSEVDAQEALRRSEERFRTMADSAPVLIWLADASGERTWFNRPWLDFTGRTMDQELGRGWEESVHPGDREALRKNPGEGGRIEYRLRRRDGVWRRILDQGVPMPGEGDDFAGYIGSCTDITEVRESEERLRAITDNIPNLGWMAEADGHIYSYNRRWIEYTGRTAEEMEGWGWQAVHHPDTLPLVMKGWNEALRSGEQFEMEFPLLGADGQYRWFLTQVRPVRNEAGEVVRWFGTNTDIDDKRKVEQALRESEELARSVIEGNPDSVALLDASGRTLLINEKGRWRRQMTGGAQSVDANWVDTWSREDRKAAAEAFSRALRGNPASFEASAVGKSGDRIWWEVALTPLGPAASRILCIARDVTDARKAEQELRQTAKLESLGVMAGGIAHDFNNLLTGILGNASLLKDSVGDEDRPLADDIVLAAERAADLTKQMLAYSGKGRFEVARIDLSVLVREMLRLLKPSMAKNVEIALDLEEGCFVECDPGQIQQVVMNVMINAAEAMDGKPGLISIRTGCRETERPHVFFEVGDTGVGMDEKTKARIFDPFFTTKFTGRGLGLAAVSGIVRGHKGSMDVKSAPGKGTTFTVTFPAADGATIGTGGAGQKKKTALQGVVLLADDEDIVRRVGEAVLRRHGFEVKTANDGREALEVFRRHRGGIDLIVLDMMMPVMSGEDALKEIRALDDTVPVIVCSGFNEVEVIRRFTSERVGAFLQKPYTASVLVEKVREIMGRRGS